MKTLAVICVSMAVSLTGCAGQRVASDFVALERQVPAGATVFVTTRSGDHVKGRVVASSPSSLSLSLRDNATRQFIPADVSEIRVRDPLWNGLVIGAGVTGLMVGALNDASCTAPNASPNCKKVSRGAGVAIGTAIGAGIGTWIDAVHHRRVFRGAPSARSSRVIIEPFVTPTRASIRVSLRR